MQPKTDALEWLDYTVTVTLNPAKTDVSTITEWQASVIIRKAGEEKNSQKYFLRHYTIGLYSPRKIRLLLNQYQRWLLLLLDHAYENALQIGNTYLHVYQACQYIIDTIEQIYELITSLFPEYVFAELKVPAINLDEIKKEVKYRADVIKISLDTQTTDTILTDTLFHALYSFTDAAQTREISIREVRYKKELILALEKLLLLSNPTRIRDDLQELLIYLNFNSRAFMNYYTVKIAEEINALSSPGDKIDRLLFHHKNFNQMHYKPGAKLNPFYGDVKEIVGNWFAQEISYQEKKYQWDVSPLASPVTTLKENKAEPFKILCFLSVDQIAIILRALDSLRIIQARSMNQVFESIVPYLSTTRKQQISWESMRSKAYNFEENDKKVVIGALESIIAWVREY